MVWVWGVAYSQRFRWFEWGGGLPTHRGLDRLVERIAIHLRGCLVRGLDGLGWGGGAAYSHTFRWSGSGGGLPNSQRIRWSGGKDGLGGEGWLLTWVWEVWLVWVGWMATHLGMGGLDGLVGRGATHLGL